MQTLGELSFRFDNIIFIIHYIIIWRLRLLKITNMFTFPFFRFYLSEYHVTWLLIRLIVYRILHPNAFSNNAFWHDLLSSFFFYFFLFYFFFFILIVPCVRQVDTRQPPRLNNAWPTAMGRRPDRRWPLVGRPGRRRTGRRPCRQSVPAVASRVRRISRTGPTTRWRRWWASPITCHPGRRRAPAAAHPARPVLMPRRPAVPGPHHEDLNIRQTPPVCIYTPHSTKSQLQYIRQKPYTSRD